MNVSDSPNINLRYPGDLLIQRFRPRVYYLTLYAPPIWFIIGFFGNIISFIIWASKRQRKKNSSAIYLATLALSDLLLIVCLFSEYLRTHSISFFKYNIQCQIFQGIFMFLQYYSIVLTFGFTLERWIAICYPFKRQKLCSTSRAFIAVSILALIVSCFASFFASTWWLEDGVCTVSKKWQSDYTFYIYMTATECIFSLVVPIATLVFNCLVLREISHLVKSKIKVGQKKSGLIGCECCARLFKRQRNPQTCGKCDEAKRKPLVSGGSHSSPPANKDQASFQSATVMLVILSFYLIMCTLPAGIVFVFQTRFSQIREEITDEEVLTDPEWQSYLRALTAKVIIDFLCSSHYACNFFIYLLTGTGFREELKDLIMCRSEQSRSDMVTAPNKTVCIRDNRDLRKNVAGDQEHNTNQKENNENQ